MPKQTWPFYLQANQYNLNDYIENLSGTLDHVEHEGEICLFINKGSTCWIASLYLCQIDYIKSELKKLSSTIWEAIICKILFLFRKFTANLADIDRVVYVNHNLYSTTLWPNSFNHLEELIKKVVGKYPRHAIVFRSLNEHHNKRLMHQLCEQGCHVIPIRDIAVFNPIKTLKHKHRKMFQKDLKLVENKGYEAFHKKSDLKESDYKRIHQLYTMLYIEKYGAINPKYTLRFFQEILQDDRFSIIGLRKDQIDAFSLCMHHENILICPCVGYDFEKDRRISLYRQLTALMTQHAIDNKIKYNRSSGVLNYKKNRGAEQILESYAVYAKHLPFFKRYAWGLFGFIVGKSWIFMEKRIVTRLNTFEK